MKKEMKIDTGKILLAEKYPPSVRPGCLTVSAKQELAGDKRLDGAKIREERFTFSCEAAAWTLGDEEIYSSYPPKNSFGLFEKVLPHMVFRKRTLPWERNMQIEEAPWMALLLFSEEEDAKLKSMKAKEVLEKDETTYCPVTKKEGYAPDANVFVLDVAADLFSLVCPLAQDLPLLAHARQVNRDNKATEDIFQGEWLSVLTCNRLPRSGTGEQGVRNTVYLVSLEDFGDFLLNGKLREQLCSLAVWKRVRIPVLTSFSFYSKNMDYSFEGCFKALGADTLKIRTDRAKGALPFLQRGYTAHDHILRDGGATVSFYHGPFLPWDAPVCEAKYEFFTDARLIYQPELGMFDVSMSTAANLGRMLALQNEAFAGKLLSFRAGNRLKAEERHYRSSILPDAYGMKCNMADGMEEIDAKALMDKEVEGLLETLLESKRQELTNGTSNEEKKDSGSRKEQQNTGGNVNANADKMIDNPRKRKSALLKEGSYYSFLEMKPDIPDEITDFLAKLSLFYQVPFSYLVPDERLLPADSIRFFRIDFNWINALLDGAMSLGRCFEEDYAQDITLIEQILSDIYRKRSSIRPILQRKSIVEQESHIIRSLAAAENESGQVNTGFLLRSELVRGFQGLEFAAYHQKGETEPLPCLRLQVVGNEILIGIYAGECNYLEIKQPPEGMHFGMEKTGGSGYQKRLRSLETGELLADEEKNIVPIIMQNEKEGIVNFSATASGIGERLGLAEVTSAHMALQMIQNPFTGVVESNEA